MKKPKINWNKNVIGCNIGGQIYMHPDLKNYPKLFRAVYEHEVGHTEDYSHHDIAHDFFNEELEDVKLDYWKFILKHPRTILTFSPIMRLNGKWVFDITMGGFWLSMAIIAYFFYWII